MSWVASLARFPIERRNRATACRRSAAATLHNQDRSHLFKLPPEIILLIAEQLQHGAALLSFQASAAKFQEILALYTPENSALIDLEARAGFRDLLDRDYFMALCERERIKKLDKTYKACSGCMRAHSYLAFSEDQLRASPDTRMCRGHRGSYRLCKHKSCSYKELATFITNPSSDDIICRHPTHEPKIWDGYPTIRPRWDTKTFEYTSFQLLFEVDKDQAMNSEELRSRLKKLDRRICPHLYTSSPELFANVSDLEFIERIGFGSLIIRCRTCGFFEDQIFQIHRDWWFPKHHMCSHGVFLFVARRVDLSNGPHSPDWLLQIEGSQIADVTRMEPLWRRALYYMWLPLKRWITMVLLDVVIDRAVDYYYVNAG